MGRTMDEILAPEEPHEPQGDAATPAETEAEPTPSETLEVEAKPESSAAKPTETAGDDGDQEPVPDDLTGLKKALSAARGDRRKVRKQWQEAELRLAKLEGHFQALHQMGARQQPEQVRQPEVPKIPDFFAAPEDHLTHREQVLRAQLKAELETEASRLRDEQFRRDAVRSEKRMRKEAQDYDEARTAVLRAHGSNSQFWSQLLNEPDPAEVVYEEGKRILRGGISEREAKLQAEIEELRAKMAVGGGSASQSVQSAPRQPIPKSIAGARGVGAGTQRAWSGPRSLDEILS
jgi:hypothetical protein